MYEALKQFVIAFVLPPGGPLALVLLGLLAWQRRPRLARALCWAGAVSLWLASTPIVAAALVSMLGGTRPVNMAEAAAADAIVILGGGVRTQAPEYGGDTLGRLTLERTRYGAHLARQTGLPVAVSGGAPDEDTRPEGELMREALHREFGVTVQWEESFARNTRENAANVAKLLRAEGKRRVVLVMHGFDVRRARRLFEEAGLEVVAAPTQLSRWDALTVSDFLPSAVALQTSSYSLYECVALVWEAVRSSSPIAEAPIR